jgi:hypothetical protein
MRHVIGVSNLEISPTTPLDHFGGKGPKLDGNHRYYYENKKK